MEDPSHPDLLWQRMRQLEERIDHLEGRLLHWFDQYDEMRSSYIAMRRERNDAMDQMFNLVMGQLGFEVHLETHDDERRNEIRAAAILQRKQMAQQMKDMVEMWQLKNEVEAEDLGEMEGSDS